MTMTSGNLRQKGAGESLPVESDDAVSTSGTSTSLGKLWRRCGTDHSDSQGPDDGGDTGNGASRDGADGASSSVGFC